MDKWEESLKKAEQKKPGLHVCIEKLWEIDKLMRIPPGLFKTRDTQEERLDG